MGIQQGCCEASNTPFTLEVRNIHVVPDLKQRTHLQIRMVGGCGWVRDELAGDLAAGSNEAHNVWVEGQLPLQVHLLLEQLQGACVQPCKQTRAQGNW